jgi:hypothetical protein
MLLAVAITDIPFEAEEPMLKYTGSNSVKLISHDPNILFIREIVPAEVRTSALSVHSNYFDPAEPTELVFGETVDKFQTGDFLTAKMYGVRTVVTNVSSCDYEVEVLAQIPQGSIPVNNGFRTRSWRVTLPPFGTFVKEYYFYFPSVGEYTHLPVHINKNGFTIGYHLETRNLNAVEKIEVADKSSWAYLSRDGTDDEVLDFLANSPQARSVNLKKIMWRLSDPKFFDDITRVLKDRQMYNTQIWSYSLVADRGGKELGEYLSQNKKFAGEFGPAFNSDLVTYDPFTQRQVCVMDMMPMVNPRSNGNTADASQNYKDAYVALLTRLAFTSSSRKSIGVIDQMNLAYFLASLGRLSTAKMVFSEIDKKAAREASRLSYDYLACYLAFFEKDPAGLKQARGISDQYKDEATLPLSKRTLFQAISEQLDEIKASAKGDPVFQKAAIEEETRLKTVPFLDFNATPDHKIVVDFRNLDTLEINFYLVDIEFQFSQQPFRDEAENYKFVNPNLSKTVKPGNKNPYAFSKPPALKGQNSVVEIIGKRGDKVMSVCAKPDQDNELMVETSKDCGQIRVLSMKKKAPISGAYCKVYGRVQGSQESIFYKDGYTDLRGRFDYVSVSSDVVSDVDCLAVLVMTEANGATVMEIGDLGVERSSLGLGAPKQA